MSETLQLMDETEVVSAFMADAASFISKLPPADIRIQNEFAPGVYLRKMFAREGSVIVSKIHKTEHFFILAQGRILVFDGVHEAVILKAPYQGRTMAGAQRMGIVLDEALWINVHPTDIQPEDTSEEAEERAVALIEQQIIEPIENLKLHT